MASVPRHQDVGPIPAAAGIGLRHVHLEEFPLARPSVGWVEIHAENFFGDGGAPFRQLERVRRDIPLSVHGVGLSLGSADPPDPDHLTRLKTLVERFAPGLVSEHVAWTAAGGVHFGDLLPLPYTEEALDLLCRNIEIAQQALGRRILMENPSTYLRFAESVIPEWEFLAALPQRTGCGLLLDVNNIVVSCANHGTRPDAYLDAIDPATVCEVHVAGHSLVDIDGTTLRIDDHGTAPQDDVWALLQRVLDWIGPRPVLLEWDTNIPALETLITTAGTAQAMLDRLVGEPLGGRHVA